MTTRHHSTLALMLLLALGAPQLAACESSAAAAAPVATGEQSTAASATAGAVPSPGASSTPAAQPSSEATPRPAETRATLPEGVAPPRAARFGAASGTAAATGAGISIRRLVVAHDVADREPVVREGAFTAGQDRVFAFVEARNADTSEVSIRIYFDGPNGQRVGDIGLAVPGAQRRWRTWGFSRYVTTPGTWEAVVVDDTGTVLARQAFEVR